MCPVVHWMTQLMKCNEINLQSTASAGANNWPWTPPGTLTQFRFIMHLIQVISMSALDILTQGAEPFLHEVNLYYPKKLMEKYVPILQGAAADASSCAYANWHCLFICDVNFGIFWIYSNVSKCSRMQNTMSSVQYVKGLACPKKSFLFISFAQSKNNHRLLSFKYS